MLLVALLPELGHQEQQQQQLGLQHQRQRQLRGRLLLLLLRVRGQHRLLLLQVPGVPVVAGAGQRQPVLLHQLLPRLLGCPPRLGSCSLTAACMKIEGEGCAGKGAAQGRVRQRLNISINSGCSRFLLLHAKRHSPKLPADTLTQHKRSLPDRCPSHLPYSLHQASYWRAASSSLSKLLSSLLKPRPGLKLTLHFCPFLSQLTPL